MTLINDYHGEEDVRSNSARYKWGRVAGWICTPQLYSTSSPTLTLCVSSSWMAAWAWTSSAPSVQQWASYSSSQIWVSREHMFTPMTTLTTTTAARWVSSTTELCSDHARKSLANQDFPLSTGRKGNAFSVRTGFKALRCSLSSAFTAFVKQCLPCSTGKTQRDDAQNFSSPPQFQPSCLLCRPGFDKHFFPPLKTPFCLV